MRIRYFPLLTALFLVAAACAGGGDVSDSGVVSLQDGDIDAPTTTAAGVSGEEALLQFSQCMRDEGIDLPDVGIDAEGAPDIDPALIASLDLDSPAFRDALDLCQPVLARSNAFNIDLDPELAARIEDQLFIFSQCMRDNGYPDFPDPSNIGSGPPYPLSVLAQISNPDFEAAIELCQTGLAFPGGLDGS